MRLSGIESSVTQLESEAKSRPSGRRLIRFSGEGKTKSPDPFDTIEGG